MDHPTFHPPSAATRHVPHRRHESALSIMSVSSYGHVINAGSFDPFYYGFVSAQARRRISFNRLIVKALLSAHHHWHPVVVPEPVHRKRPSTLKFYYQSSQDIQSSSLILTYTPFMISSLIESLLWTIIIPLPVIMELDGLSTNTVVVTDAVKVVLLNSDRNRTRLRFLS